MQAQLINLCRFTSLPGCSGSLAPSRRFALNYSTSTSLSTQPRNLLSRYGNPLNRSGASSSTKYVPSFFAYSQGTSLSQLKTSVSSRQYCTTTVEEMDRHQKGKGRYTEEQLMSGTIDIHGFRVLSESEEVVDIPKWEKLVTRAFHELRFSDVVTAYSNIKGLGPNRSAMAELHMRALDYLGSREEEILESYKEMKELGIPILSEAYAKVIKAYMRLDSPKNALNVFQQMQNDRVPGTAEVYNVLLGLYFKDDPQDITTVQGILELMKKNQVEPDNNTLDRLMLAYCEIGQTDLIKQTYEELVVVKGLKPKRITCSILAETLLQEGKSETAFKFLQQLDELRVYPRLRTYELLISHHLENGKKDKADKILAELVHDAKLAPTLSIFKAFFKYHHKRNAYLGIQEVLGKMIIGKVAPDFEILETLLEVYYNAHRDADFFATFVDMLDRQMLPERKHWSRRIQLMCQSNYDDFSTLMPEYEYLLQAGMVPTEMDLRLIMNAFFNAGRYDLAAQFAKEELPTYDVKLDVTDYTRFLKGYIETRQTPSLMSTWQDFSTLRANDPAFQLAEPSILMIRGFFEAQQPDEAIELFNTLVKEVQSKKVSLDKLQAPRLMEVFAPLGEDSHTFLQQTYDLIASAAPEAMSIDVFDVYIKFLATEHIESAYTHFRAMQETYKIPPTATLYQAVMEGFGRQTEREKSTRHVGSVVEIFKQAMFDPGLIEFPTQLASTFFLFVMRHGSQPTFSHAIAWYKEIHRFNKTKVDFEQTILMRKWLATLTSDSFVPETYMARDLSLLASAALPLREYSSELQQF